MVQKIKVNIINYIVIDKEKDEIRLIRFQKDLAKLLKVSTRTLQRYENYENERFKVIYHPEVVLTPAEVIIRRQSKVNKPK